MLKNPLSLVLISTYPSLFLYSRFYDQTDFSSFLLTIGLGIGALLFTLSLTFLLAKNWSKDTYHRNGKIFLIATMAMFFFLIYGHIFSLINQLLISGVIAIGQHNLPIGFFKISINIVLSLIALRALFLWVRLLKGLTKKSFEKLSAIVFIFLLILSISPLVIISNNIIGNKNSSKIPSNQTNTLQEESSPQANTNTCEHCNSDIYLIILDGYARNDILQKFYNYDNTPFLDQLSEKGFQIFNNASANYGITFLSLASTFNFNYIDTFFNKSEQPSKADFLPLIRNSALANTLKEKNYKYIHLSSTYGPTMLNENADEVASCQFGWLKNDFIRVYIEGTFLTLLNSSAVNNLAECHLQNFNWLNNIASNDKDKKLVMAHIVMPHHPYLFNSQGKVLRNANLSDQFEYQKLLWADREAYIEQLKFLNNTMLSAVDQIKRDSEHPPFIIIMSDHGPQLIDKKGKQNISYAKGRSSILLSVHTPDQRKDLTIGSSVNLFRELFNQYYNENYEILPNIYYHSHYTKPFTFKENKLDNIPQKQ